MVTCTGPQSHVHAGALDRDRFRRGGNGRGLRAGRRRGRSRARGGRSACLRRRRGRRAGRSALHGLWRAGVAVAWTALDAGAAVEWAALAQAVTPAGTAITVAAARAGIMRRMSAVVLSMCQYRRMMIRRETFGMDVCARHLRTQQVPLHGHHHGWWSAEIDIAVGDVGHQLAQVSGRQKMCCRGITMVADDIENLDAPFAASWSSSARKIRSPLPDHAVDQGEVAGHLLQQGADRGDADAPRNQDHALVGGAPRP